MKKLLCELFLILLLLTGCEHYHRIERTMPEAPNGFRDVVVAIGRSEVKEGDTVILYTRVCVKRKFNWKGSRPYKCERKTIGEGQVIKATDKETSLIRVPVDIEINDKTLAEKKHN